MKKFLKVLLLTAVMTMLFSASAFAADSSNDVAANKAKNTTLYANCITGNEAVTPNELNLIETPAPVKGVTYKYDITSITSSDRSVVSYVKTDAGYKLIAKKNGKAVINFSYLTYKNDTLVSGKQTKKKITITVKSVIDEINFNDAVVSNNAMTITAVTGKVNVGAYVNADASNKKLSYSLDNNLDANKKKMFSVDGKGNVKATKFATSGSTATLVVKSADFTKKYTQIEERITITAADVAVAKADISLIGENCIKNVIYMKTNDKSEYKTYNTCFKVYDSDSKEAKKSDVLFSSSNTKVATVDNNGKVTAVANGSAVISVASKAGNAIKCNKGKVVKYTVKVTTDVDRIIVPEEVNVMLGKKVTIKPAVNTNAGNKKFTYSVDEASAEYITVKNGTIASTGKIVPADVNLSVKVESAAKGSKANEICNKANPEKVEVTVINPVDRIVIDEDALTEYAKEEDGSEEMSGWDWSELVSITAKEGTPTYDDECTFKSSNTKVISIDAYGNMTANGAGKAKITLTAVDGSKKAASLSITVTQKITKIDLTCANGISNNTIYTTKGQKIQLKASVNKTATDKKLVYAGEANISEEGHEANHFEVNNKGLVTISADAIPDDVFTVTVRAENAANSVAENAEVRIIVKDEVKVATKDNVSILYDDDADEYIVLEKNDPELYLVDVRLLVDPDAQLKDTKVTWGTSNKKLATVAQVSQKGEIYSASIKAIGVGQVDITAKDCFGDEVVFHVLVVENSETVKKGLDKTIADQIKAEDRSWTGLDLSFDAANSTINADILDPEKPCSDITGTGIADVMTAVYDNSFRKGQIEYYVFDKQFSWELTREGTAIVVKDNEGQYADQTCEDMNGVAEYFQSIVSKDHDELISWANVTIYITGWKDTFDFEKYSDYQTYSKDFTYDVKFNLSQEAYENWENDNYAQEISVVDSELLENAGIDELVFDGSKNELRVMIGDADSAIDSQAVRDFVATVANNTISFNDDITIIAHGKTVDYPYYYEEGQNTEDFFSDTVEDIIDMLNEKGVYELGLLQGSSATVELAENVNGKYYGSSYTIVIDRTYENVVAEKNAKIALAVDELNTDEDGYLVDAAYSDQKFTFTLTADSDKEKNGVAMNLGCNTGITNVLQTAIEGEFLNQVIVTSVAGKNTVLTGNDVKDVEKIAKAMLEGQKNATFADIYGKNAIVCASFNVCGKTYEIAYIIDFEKAATVPETGTTSIDVNIINVEEPVAEDVEEEPIYEDVFEELVEE